MSEANSTDKPAKHKRPKRSEDLQVKTEPGDNTKYIQHSLRLAAMPDIDVKNARQVAVRVTEYFEACAADDMRPSVAGLALALNTDRRRLWEWAKAEKSDRSDVIKKAYGMLELQMNDYMLNGKINPVSGIFLLKNHFGYTDKQELVVTPNNPLGEQKSLEDIENRYIECVARELPEGETENLTD